MSGREIPSDEIHLLDLKPVSSDSTGEGEQFPSALQDPIEKCASNWEASIFNNVHRRQVVLPPALLSVIISVRRGS